MSGIAGIICFDGAPVEPGFIEAMTASMAHRGLNGIRHWSRGTVALGHCMLQTTPESLEETQPLLNEDESLALVMDGRVDNWEELRTELRSEDARLRNRSDAELVLRAYERWGRDCVHHIDGDFALVIWDARAQEVFCARDRIGFKPFQYYWDRRRLAFASEPRALLALPWVPRRLNEGMVAEFLATDWCTPDETFWQGVYRLVPAHRMMVGTNGPRIENYWIPDLSREIRYKRREEYVDHYRSLLFDTVRRLSRSHKPIACAVSGGLDSSAIFAVGEHLRREGRLLAPGIDGYTLLFDDRSEADEIDYARAVGRHLGREVSEVRPFRQSLAWHRQLAQHHAVFPPYPNGSFSLSLRQAARNAGSTALLSGAGGDEWLGGNRAYYAETLAGRDGRAFFDSLACALHDQLRLPRKESASLR